MLTLLGFLILGIIAGALARLLVPGRDPMGLLGTMLLGIVGSFVGGFLANLLLGRGEGLLQPTGLIGSIIGAVVALLIYRAMASRGTATSRR
ncbi:MAG TPA: GlsB/YeaQ/YmgE family stress response membrane protein [Egibacteraceae bacterium]|nr:GlsB/YeaQ/YmgE family stress response membrane protein [Egibacteraceae bacterium]